MTPAEWATDAYIKHGWLHALLVSATAINRAGRSDERLFSYWTNTFNWLKKRAPADIFAEFLKHGETKWEKIS